MSCTTIVPIFRLHYKTSHYRIEMDIFQAFVRRGLPTFQRLATLNETLPDEMQFIITGKFIFPAHKINIQFSFKSTSERLEYNGDTVFVLFSPQLVLSMGFEAMASPTAKVSVISPWLYSYNVLVLVGL